MIGTAFSVVINFILQGGVNNRRSSKQRESSFNDNNDDDNKSLLLSQSISGSDYFIANSASYSLLETVGEPETAAKLSSVLIAAIPSQLVKISASLSKQKRMKGNQLMLELLREE